MSKQYNIRWTDSDNEQLRKAVKNFNAKISRLEKKDPKRKNSLPDRVTVKELKELIETRGDFNREINSLKRFSRKGAEERVIAPGNKYNLEITKWQKNEMSIRSGVVNRRRAKKYEEILGLPVTSRGKEVGYTIAQVGMGTPDEVALRPVKPFTPKMDRTDLRMKFKALRSESRESYWAEKQNQLKENVINGLKRNYNADEFKADIDQIIKAIDNMSFDEFYSRFMGETGVMEEVSPPPGSNGMELLRKNVNALKSTWIPNYRKEEK